MRSDQIKIKVCGMRQPDNIRNLLELNPDFIGFIFYPGSPRFLGEELAYDLIPSSVKKVGVFVNETIEKVVHVYNSYKLNYVQLHGNESPEYCSELFYMKIKVIKAFGIDQSFDFSITDSYLPYCNYFLFDTKTSEFGGSGRKFNWEKLRQYANELPVFLSGGISTESIPAIKSMNWLNIYAVDLNSRFEIEPGLKNITMLEGFFNEFRT